jgi:membrane protease YdiL (CAAX protease family)
MIERNQKSGWERFWERGGWWKALLLAAVYYGLYQLSALAISPLFRFAGQPGSATFVVVTTGLPILIGGILLLIFAWSVGWLGELFGPQLRGRGWMWIAVIVVLGTNILRFVALDYGKAGIPLVLSWLLTGLFIGFAEEFLTRGLVVKLMRTAGHGEVAVALVSAAVFAALHLGNAFGGAPIGATLFQVGYTFMFGIMMYLALRVTGRLIVPILLHASTDPSIFLLTSYPSASPIAPLAANGNIIVILTGLVLLIILIAQRGALPKHPTLQSIDTAPA